MSRGGQAGRVSIESGVAAMTLEQESAGGHGSSVSTAGRTAGMEARAGAEGRVEERQSQQGGGGTMSAKVQLQMDGRPVWRSSFNASSTDALVCSLESSDFWLFNVASGRKLCAFTGHNDSGVNDVKWSADKRRALSGGFDGTLSVWDVASAQCTTVLQVGSPVHSVAWWSNDRFVIAGLDTGVIEIWDVERGQRVRQLNGHTTYVYTLDVSADQKLLLSASSDRTACMWTLASGECIHTLQGHTTSVFSAIFSRDGQRALSASDDRTVRVWDVATGRSLRVLEGHTAAVNTVSWHPSDPSLAVSGSDDNSVRVWNVDTGACLGVLEGHTSSVYDYLYWSQDGQRLTSCDRNGVVVSWDLSTVLASVTTTVPADQVQYTNAKVLVVGDSGAGKSGLSMRLALNAWEKTDSTVGAWSTRWSLGAAHDATGSGEREIWLWDFGGQHDQRLVHQLFMDDTALALLVFDGQRDGVLEALRQWDRDIARASRAGCRKLLVAGRVDAGAPRMRHEDLEAFAKANGFQGYFETSAKDGTGCGDLKKAIAKAIDWDRIPWRSSPAIFKTLKDAVVDIKDAVLSPPKLSIFQRLWHWFMSPPTQHGTGQLQKARVSGRALVTFAELGKDIRTHKAGIQFTDDQLKAVLSLLSGPGVVWELKFGQYYLLHPELVSSYLQGLLRQDRLELGYAKESDVFSGELPANVPRLDDPTKDRLLLLELHHTLLERALCYREVTPDKGPILIFPTRFMADPPNVKWQPPIVVSYTYSGYVDEAYATLVVRLHHTEPFQDAGLFRDYARFTTTSGQVGVKIKRSASADPIEFEVFREPVVADRTVIEFCAFIHEHLLQYGQEVKRLRSFVCSNCGTLVASREAVMVKIGKYNEARNAGHIVAQPSAICTLCDHPVTLWDNLEAHYAHAYIERRVRELQEFSKARLQQQAAVRILIADIISLVLQAGHEVEELPVPELGTNLRVTLKPDHAQVMVVLGTPKSMQATSRGRFFESDALQFAPEWTARRLRVVLVLRADGEGIQWAPLSGARIEHQRIEFQGRRLDVEAIGGWKDLAVGQAQSPASSGAFSASPSPPIGSNQRAQRRPISSLGLHATLDAYSPPVTRLPELEWTWRDNRFDIFISFRGNEPFDPTLPTREQETIREKLARPVAEVLRSKGYSVFFDQRTLPDAVADHPESSIDDILQGLLSTQGGGLVVLLVSKTYFEKKWTLIEMAAAVRLYNRKQVRLLVVALDLSPTEITKHNFVEKICPALARVPIITLNDGGKTRSHADAEAVRAFIVERAADYFGRPVAVGKDRTTSYRNLLIAIADAMEFDLNAQGKLLTSLDIRRQPGEAFIDALRRAPSMSETTAAELLGSKIAQHFSGTAYADLGKAVTRYHEKWLASWAMAAPAVDLRAVQAEVEQWRDINH